MGPAIHHVCSSSARPDPDARRPTAERAMRTYHVPSQQVHTDACLK